MSASYSYTIHPLQPPLDDQPLKPSERFARPNGPVFLVDQERDNNHPAFSYTYKEQQQQASTYPSSSENSSPYSTWSVRNANPGGAEAESPTTSIEEDSSSLSPTYISGRNANPPLPPKNAERVPGLRINLPETRTEHEQFEEQESRDQLSPLLSPRKLDYGHINHATPPGAVDTIGGKEPQELTIPQSPRRRSFFKFGKSGAGNVTAISQQIISDSWNVSATSVDVLGDGKKDKTKKHARRNSADAAFSQTGAPAPPIEDANFTSTFSDLSSSPTTVMKNMTLQENFLSEKRSSRSLTKGIVASLGRRSKSASRASTVTPTTISQGHGMNIPTWRKDPYETGHARSDNGISSALQEDWINVPRHPDSSKDTKDKLQNRLQTNEPKGEDRNLPPVPAKPQRSPETRRQDVQSHPQNKTVKIDLPKTPSPIKSRHKALTNWKHSSSSPFIPSPPPSSSQSSTSPSAQAPSRENMRSPPFFVRGKQALKNGNSGKGVSSVDFGSPPTKGNLTSHFSFKNFSLGY